MGHLPARLEENWWNLGDCPNAWEMVLQTSCPMFSEVYITHRTSMTKPFRRHLWHRLDRALRASIAEFDTSSNVTDTVFIGMADG